MGTSKLLHLEDQLPRPKMKLSLIAALFLAATSATGSSVGDIVQAMLPYCTHGQMRREVKAALEECSASCSSDETATEGYYDATTTDTIGMKLPPMDTIGMKLPPLETIGMKLPLTETIGMKLPLMDIIGMKLPPMDTSGMKLPLTDTIGMKLPLMDTTM